MVKYLFQGGMEVFTQGSFNVHDSVGLEREAIHKTDRVFEEIYRAVMVSSIGLKNGNFESGTTADWNFRTTNFGVRNDPEAAY